MKLGPDVVCAAISAIAPIAVTSHRELRGRLPYRHLRVIASDNAHAGQRKDCGSSDDPQPCVSSGELVAGLWRLVGGRPLGETFDVRGLVILAR